MKRALAIAALALVLPQTADAGGRSASMSVSAVVQRSAVFRLTDTFQQIGASNVDFSKGYLDLPGMLQIVVNAGSATRRVLNVTVEVEPNPELVRAVQLRARADTPELRDSATRDEEANLALGYRVLLTDRARDGDFSVPVTLTVNL